LSHDLAQLTNFLTIHQKDSMDVSLPNDWAKVEPDLMPLNVQRPGTGDRARHARSGSQIHQAQFLQPESVPKLGLDLDVEGGLVGDIRRRGSRSDLQLFVGDSGDSSLCIERDDPVMGIGL
jgi:hypothetical protein